MGFKATKEQQNAIDASGSVLVSAAAGSGKTAVLVERVIRLLTKKDPITADRLVIVTFTAAAAAEMRSRIQMRLDAECDARPSDINLKKQRALLESAKICTIDSFCIDLLREHFGAAGVSPSFKILDSAVQDDLMYKISNEIVCEKLAADDDNFTDFLNIIGHDITVPEITGYIRAIYNKSMSMADPAGWLDSARKKYTLAIENTLWFTSLFDKTVDHITEIIPLISELSHIIESDPELTDKYGKDIKELKALTDLLSEAVNSRDYDKTRAALSEFLAIADDAFKKPSAGIKEAAANLQSEYKKIKSLQPEFKSGLDDCRRLNALAGSAVNVLCDLVGEFSARFESEMLRRDSLNFSLVEHKAYELMCRTENGKIIYTDLQKEIVGMYDEVLVDEYQDVNDLQDSLFNVISDFGKKLFVVGDVKQSIYGFRNAAPENFIAKKDEFPDYVDGATKSKILLNANFRSRRGICDYTNFVFERIMRRSVGSIEYNEDEKLNAKAAYPPCDAPDVELHLLQSDGNAEQSRKNEAAQIAEYIKNNVGNLQLYDSKLQKNRPAEYGDFTVLLRSHNTKGQVYLDEFQKCGIPANIIADSNFNDPEIKTVLSLLQVIDNPIQDIPLISVMSCPLYDLSFDEIAKIRTSDREHSMYTALIVSAENGNENAKTVLNSIARFRRFAATESVVKLIDRIYSETSALEIFSACEEGAVKRENLLMLRRFAQNYYQIDKGGLSGFLRYMEKSVTQKTEVTKGAMSGNCVRIMSMHKSKGLQFPVCILGSLSSAFNALDSRGPLVISDTEGIGLKVVDDRTGLRVNTPQRIGAITAVNRKNISEELRLLYVAFTRAEEKLYISVSANDIGKYIEKQYAELGENALKNGRPDIRAILSATCFSDLIIRGTLFHPSAGVLRSMADAPKEPSSAAEEPISVVIDTPCSDEDKGEEFDDEVSEMIVDRDLSDEFKERFDFEYPYFLCVNRPSKTTVTQLLNDEAGSEFEFSSVPKCLSENGLSAAEKGTATHKFLQYADYGAVNNIDGEIERLTEWEYLTDAEAESIDRNAVDAFFQSRIFKRAQSAKFCKREQRFIYAECQEGAKPSDDDTVVQGAVDLVFAENDGMVIVDFKTTRLDNEDEFTEKYRIQLDIYAKAMESTFSLPVKEKYVYSFYLNKAIKIS